MHKKLAAVLSAGALSLAMAAPAAAGPDDSSPACDDGHGTHVAHSSVPHANTQAHQSIPHFCPSEPH